MYVWLKYKTQLKSLLTTMEKSTENKQRQQGGQ